VPVGSRKPELEANKFVEGQAPTAEMAVTPSATIAAVAAFTGVRKSELRGLLWENYYGEQVDRSSLP
jgi:hypothetical protein